MLLHVNGLERIGSRAMYHRVVLFKCREDTQATAQDLIFLNFKCDAENVPN